MPEGERRLWSAGRKAMGNLLPLILVIPFFALALQEASKEGLTAKMGWWLAAALATGWLGVCYLGQAGSGAVRRKVERELHKAHPFDQRERHFVGFAPPGHKGLLDAHEDLGFILLDEEQIQFFGEKHRLRLPWSDFSDVRFQANIHTLLGLGGWTALLGERNGKPIRVLIEPRSKMTAIGNAFAGARLREDFLKRIRPRRKTGPKPRSPQKRKH